MHLVQHTSVIQQPSTLTCKQMNNKRLAIRNSKQWNLPPASMKQCTAGWTHCSQSPTTTQLKQNNTGCMSKLYFTPLLSWRYTTTKQILLLKRIKNSNYIICFLKLVMACPLYTTQGKANIERSCICRKNTRPQRNASEMQSLAKLAYTSIKLIIDKSILHLLVLQLPSQHFIGHQLQYSDPLFQCTLKSQAKNY